MQTSSFCFVFSQNPGSSFVDVFVSAADESPNAFDSAIDFHSVHIFCEVFSSGFYQSHQIFVNSFDYASVSYYAAMVFFNHANSSVEQVAQVVSKVGVNTGDECVAGEVAVVAEYDFAEQEVTDSVSAKFVNQCQRIDNIAFGFGHFVAIDYEPAVTINFLRQFYAHSFEHDRPNDGVETHDFFTNKVQGCRPEFVEHCIISTVFNTGQVVEQCVKPNVNNVFFVERYRNTPVEGGAGNAQIFQALFYEVNHFVTTACRLDEVGVFFDELQPPILVFGKFEEVAFFLHFFYGATAVRAFAIYQLAFQPVGFARYAVEAFVVLFIDIALFKDFGQNVLNNFVVTFFASTNEVIVGDVQFIPKLFEVSNDCVNVFNRGNAFFLSFTLNFQTMFVTAGKEENFFTFCAVETSQGICNGGAVSVTNVQFVTGVVNRSSNIISRFSHSEIPSPSEIS